MASAAPVTLSVVIPAYNEATRLPATLAAVGRFLEAHAITHEVIVVDDGSRDDTAALARAAGVRVLSEPHRGKAAALRAGVQAAIGERVLLMDADHATTIDEWTKCTAEFEAGADIVIGSRELPASRRLGEPWHRHVMGRVFNWLVQLLVMRGIRDTQCGFKAMRRTVAVDLFRWSRLYPEHSALLSVPAVTAYDVELLYIARLRGYALAQIPVTWRFDAGTQVHPWRDTVRNFRDLWNVRRTARLGLYPGPATEHAHALNDAKHDVVPLENRPQGGVPLGRELAEVRDVPR